MSIIKSFFLTFFFIVNVLYANDIAYSFHVSNEKPYEKEAIFLEVNLTQVDQSKVMLFKFSLKDSIEYKFHQVGFKEHEKYHDLRHEYTYLVYPKKSGKVLLEFEMRKSITDDDKVAYSISGDRDNVKGLEKEDIAVALKPLILEVKALPMGIDIVGNFTFEHTLDKIKTEAFEPINLKVELKGKGFLSSFNLLEKSNSYRLFTQSPKFKTFHTKVGSSSSLKWDYAVSSENSFTLPSILLKAFNPQTQKIYDLSMPSYIVEVEKVDVSSLLDNEDYPARAKGIDWSFWSWAFSYVVVFVAGLLMPRDFFKKQKHVMQSKEAILSAKIKSTKTHKGLLDILLLENNMNFSKAIKALEGVVYNNEKTSLSKIKEMI
ncbi:MAG: Unknown protein [uncultured Sulfurovum sp.]|uniref:BatD n=1 Tax=uncultured Sulfurovum sp. TaxID=269237 RepID=A0A6S6S4D1_9BACT|nr:MAG: Unknown protein [uncultured Sulfurovum sp.]